MSLCPSISKSTVVFRSCRLSSSRFFARVQNDSCHMAAMALVGLVLLVFCGCASTPAGRNSSVRYNEILHGTIDYPFVGDGRPLGRRAPEERFIIKSAVGDREYVVEIPGGAREYDVEIPLAALDDTEAGDGLMNKPRGLANPATTDREMVANLPSVDKLRPTDANIMDSAFGVGSDKGPRQSPSYTLGIAKINNLYLERKYEFALIEINNMLAFYPNSPQLHKMKGTVLVKMNQLALAEESWLQALRLTPNDKALRKGVARLQKMIRARAAYLNSTDPQAPPLPQPVGKVEADPTSSLIQ